jgi:ATP-dependent helicase/nuclease subunit B
MHVFNVPASAPFLRTVISALVDGRLIDGFEARRAPENLASATIFLPTRRATRLAREAFLDVLNGEAVILPRLIALGDIDEDELIFAQAASNAPATALDLLPAIDALERRLTLAQLITAWARRLRPGDAVSAPLVISGPASALALADDLARLMDDMQTRKVPWETLDQLVPEEHDRYWQLTLDFLKIAREAWPAHLREIGRIEPFVRRDLLIASEAERLASHKTGPVIAAGSTGSMPSTAALLHAIAKLPHCAVVLPGLDTDLDDDSWAMIGGVRNAAGALIAAPAQGHPQFAMHALLDRFGISRRQVEELAPPADFGRETLMSEAMRPSDSTALWRQQLSKRHVSAKIARGMQKLAVIEAGNVEMEALAIAVAMREAQHKGTTAALVTPNRALARRVLSALERWNLDCNDSGGDSLLDTQAGLFARLIATVVAEQFAPAPLLGLLKHPLFRLGRQTKTLRTAVADLELVLLRGTRPPPGLDGLRRSFDAFLGELGKFKRQEPSLLHRSELRARIADYRLDAVNSLITDLARAFGPMAGLDGTAVHDLTKIAALHHAAVEQLSTDDGATAMAFEGVDGLALLGAFDDAMADGAQQRLAVKLDEYPELFETAFGSRTVRRVEKPHALLHIYGQLEARLSHSDRVILGSLTEGIWPPEPRSDPWLSRPMRHDIGLDLPERRIGLSAHDFVQLTGANEVILTHAAKVGGAPAVASRFLHRLKAVAGDELWDAACKAGNDYLRYAEELDRPIALPKAIEQPAPKPPRSVRPVALSVTEIEDWLRDPYTIYAKHILRLSPLDPIDMPPSAAHRGSAIHNALGEFAQKFPEALPDDAASILRQVGQQHFAPLMDRAEARALWWPRFLRIASWFAGWEQVRRDGLTRVLAESYGSISISLDEGRSFKLSARADRIELLKDGSFAILDYKTGTPPTGRQVAIGLSPQLTLTAAILREGGFDDIASAASISELSYVKLSGNDPPGEPFPLELKRNRGDAAIPPDQAAVEARQKLEELIRKFDDEAQPYNSLVLSMWARRYGTYDDLARVKEWFAGRGDDA